MISSWVPGVLEAKSWGTHIRLGTTVDGAAFRSMLLLVVMLLLWFSCYTATAHRSSSANNNNQQCCWLSMSIGSSGGTAVKTAALVAAPLGSAVLACCGHRSLPRLLSVLPYRMVPGTICPGIRTYFGLELCFSATVCHF